MLPVVEAAPPGPRRVPPAGGWEPRRLLCEQPPGVPMEGEEGGHREGAAIPERRPSRREEGEGRELARTTTASQSGALWPGQLGGVLGNVDMAHYAPLEVIQGCPYAHGRGASARHG